MTISVERADGKEIDALAKLESEEETGWTESKLYDSFLAGGIIYKILSEGRIQGYCLLRQMSNEAEILNIVVASASRSKGLGTQLLISAMNQLPLGTSVFLEVRESNIIAQALYTKMGFVRVGVRKKYYQPVNANDNLLEDALIFKKS